ncbi:MATE family efflux transporter [Haliangium sp.]|uniref:MATE family efflux transporter n=1 Tax=Haliangium sp. TaxID=2663208 RepID=UPI003D0E4995
MSNAPVTHRRVFAIAAPIMLSNVSTPLIGVVDTGVVGQLPDPAYIGGVAIGALIFTFLLWAFGFLRMGTTGLTAQAVGANDVAEVRAGLTRALLIAAAAGAVLIVAQRPLRELAFALLDGSAQVEGLARSYFDIRIWSAPAALANYALLGWFIGRGRAGVALALQLVLNLTNMGLDALFVLHLDWGVEGVAWGTLAAEGIACVVGLAVASVHLADLGRHGQRARVFDRAQLRKTLAINADIMVRSLALLFVFVFFTAEGARRGDVVLAANSILMHFISVSAFFLDGLAFATEALVGTAVGARDPHELSRAIRLTTLWAAAVAALASVVLAVLGPSLIDVLTIAPEAREAAREYLPWAAGGPIVGVWCFQLDGIFIGATRGPEMRNAMLASAVIFLAGWWLLLPWHNHGLWAALYVHYAARTGTMAYYYPRIARSAAAAMA